MGLYDDTLEHERIGLWGTVAKPQPWLDGGLDDGLDEAYHLLLRGPDGQEQYMCLCASDKEDAVERAIEALPGWKVLNVTEI